MSVVLFPIIKNLSKGPQNQEETYTLIGNSLPDEVLAKIFDWLNCKELCTVSMVSKRWNSISRHNSLWKFVPKVMDIPKTPCLYKTIFGEAWKTKIPIFEKIRKDFRAYEHLPKELLTDDLEKQIIKVNGFTIQLMAANIKTSLWHQTEAILQNGLCLQLFPEMKQNHNFVCIAVRDNPKALEFADESLKNAPKVLACIAGSEGWRKGHKVDYLAMLKAQSVVRK